MFKIQASEMAAFMAQAGPLTSNTGSLQAVTQASQNVHSPPENETTGVLAGPLSKIPSGQAETHAPHPVQAVRIEVSVVQGGRGREFRCPENRARLDNVDDCDLSTNLS